MDDTPLDAFQRRVLIAAVVMHAIAAWYSSGYYAADEHYQVIAFAQQRFGELPAYELPWEFHAHIRSAWLPGLAYLVIKGCRASSIADPFLIAFVLRAITALLALVVVRRFMNAALPLVRPDLQRWYIGLSWLLWFLPYEHVRFASETWGGLLFLAGVTFILGERRKRREDLLMGLLFGLAFQVKPSVLVMCLGVIAWLVMRSTQRIRQVLTILLGGLVALGLGALVDAWFYGGFQPTLWNYLHMAIAGDSPRAFEVYPWYSYFPWMLKYGVWPIGAILLAAVFWLTYRAPTSWLVWSIWPYLIMLSIIPHKEVRFLFPLVDLAPLVLVLAWQELDDGSFERVTGSRVVLVLLMVINACGLLVSTTTAAGSGRTRLAKVIQEWQTGHVVSVGYDFNKELMWEVRIPSFYLSTGVKDLGSFDPSTSVKALPEALVPDLRVALVGSGADLRAEREGYRLIARTEGPLANALLKLYNGRQHGRFALYAREARTSPPSEP